MRLFHFSSDPDIRVFEPRPVRVPSPRPAGREWLNGPLVWAIDEPHEPLYLFPRDCPRVLLWIGEHTTDEDRIRWWGQRDCRMVAHIESSWWTKLTEAKLFRYELPTGSFAPLHDAGMYVSRDRVAPLAAQRISD